MSALEQEQVSALEQEQVQELVLVSGLESVSVQAQGSDDFPDRPG